MRLVIQRVSSASVTVNNKKIASISKGMLILVGFEAADGFEGIDKICGKISRLRIFTDSNGVMNLSNTDIDGDYLVVSQFTLHAETAKGNRPSYIKAARPEQAIPLYEHFLKSLSEVANKKVQSGEFGADMQVALVNDGPVTIIIDTLEKN
ncbi:MAG: D-tyrosyl-tRNA(Tyr) deacylase [Bacteroidetes bacterium]|nr:D-tyrosyl-tRNA(Tyr) deacylase [Bacteroidota bacterium]MBK8413393.1 D-tyrosyl-tRNA(Tyr) deacylase [Bacteroidota bacterium]MBK9046303.1 D-tyrosyl-tRNA(Tyr) deacylase [Bacteroidota bacterium]MBK9424892.1 D-tyrosyl-tRNA(Tyr) deacylase [Bacteroidota bacterium]MBL0070593.1 D-tyrosyl-tRNA(Tyr) deacylase [Bacteroidota bacterium]